MVSVYWSSTTIAGLKKEDEVNGQRRQNRTSTQQQKAEHKGSFACLVHLSFEQENE